MAPTHSNPITVPRGRPKRRRRTSWIVRDACDRLYGEIGRYHWNEWREVAELLGLTVIMQPDPDKPVLTACLAGDIIFIRDGLDQPSTAYLAWHEMGHAVLHAGTPDQWRALPHGDLLINKFERQANDFAETFPVWDWPPWTAPDEDPDDED